jgi:lactoylglutathione lyase
MLNIESVNHIGIRIKDKNRSIAFYELLGFHLATDTGFEDGHPIIMKHPNGVVLNLLGPSNTPGDENILMDVAEKYTGITHMALTVSSLNAAKEFLEANKIELTGSFSFGGMSAVFIRDPDRNVIELDAFGSNSEESLEGYSGHL